MFHCPVGVWVIEQRAIILSATVRSPTVIIAIERSSLIGLDMTHLQIDWDYIPLLYLKSMMLT